MPNLTPIDTCIPHEGRPQSYQSDALKAHWMDSGLDQNTWSWVATTCGTARCMNAEHMVINSPKALAYRVGQCIYCGRSAGTRDHLLPRGWSGESSRAYVVTVPACKSCNSTLGDVMAWSITERRMICHFKLRKKFRRVLRCVEYGPTDLAELGDTLRDEVVRGMADKAEVERMLAWPEHDPAYDMRACQQAGIEEPYEAGILAPRDEAVKAARAAVGWYDDDDEAVGEESPVSVIGYRSHGKQGTYRLGCRCHPCIKAHQEFASRKPKKPVLYTG